MSHPKSQHKLHGFSDANFVGVADTEFDTFGQTLVLGTAPGTLDHLWLHIQCNDFSPGSDNPCKCNAEVPHPTADINHRLPGLNDPLKNFIGIVEKPPERVIERVPKPPRTGMRAQ